MWDPPINMVTKYISYYWSKRQKTLTGICTIKYLFLICTCTTEGCNCMHDPDCYFTASRLSKACIPIKDDAEHSCLPSLVSVLLTPLSFFFLGSAVYLNTSSKKKRQSLRTKKLCIFLRSSLKSVLLFQRCYFRRPFFFFFFVFVGSTEGGTCAASVSLYFDIDLQS